MLDLQMARVLDLYRPAAILPIWLFTEFSGTLDSSRRTCDKFHHPLLQNVYIVSSSSRGGNTVISRLRSAPKWRWWQLLPPSDDACFSGDSTDWETGHGSWVALKGSLKGRLTTSWFICSFLIILCRPFLLTSSLPVSFFAVSSGSCSSGWRWWRKPRGISEHDWSVVGEERRRKGGSEWTEISRERKFCYTLSCMRAC